MKTKILLFVLIVLTQAHLTAQTPPAKTWYISPQGQKTTIKERWTENSNGQKHGKYILYLETGVVDVVAYYSFGKLNGTKTEYFGWGKIITTYKEGIIHGLFQKVESNGTIIDKGNYTNGQKTGYWVEYTTDKGSYTNGKKHGPWEIHQKGWGCDGGITKGSFNNGIITGVWTNLVVIGTKKPSQLVLEDQKEIAIPKTTGYVNLEEFYKSGYKAIFNDEGYYVEAFDDKGNPIQTK